MDIILGLIFIVVLLALSLLLAALIYGFFSAIFNLPETTSNNSNGFIVLWVLCILFLAWLYDLITYTPLGG